MLIINSSYLLKFAIIKCSIQIQPIRAQETDRHDLFETDRHDLFETDRHDLFQSFENFTAKIICCNQAQRYICVEVESSLNVENLE